MLGRVVYNTALVALSPLFSLYYLHRIFVSGKSRESWKQQLGILSVVPPRKAGKQRIWIQAVSVGEAVASVPVFQALRSLIPDAELILSTTTTTGQNVARKAVKEADYVIYFPLDFIPCVNRALEAVRPDVFVSMESEIWPNFLAAANARGIKTAIINGIVSDKTMVKSRNLRFIYNSALSNVHSFCMQSRQDMERIIELGAPADRVRVLGNCKFDEPIPELNAAERKELRNRLRLPDDAPVFVAGSTNPGEDEPVIEAFNAVRAEHPDLRMIIAPRQIERAPEIAQMLSHYGFSSGRRSEQEKLTGTEDVIILDTLGELATVYSIGDAAFVGGSLIKKGGHNILQPIAHGKPVFFGPYTFKCRDLVRVAVEAGVGFEVSGAYDLAGNLSRALGDRKRLGEVEMRAQELMAANRGASKRCAQEIVDLAACKIAG